jgi:hypothetical protein
VRPRGRAACSPAGHAACGMSLYSPDVSNIVVMDVL